MLLLVFSSLQQEGKSIITLHTGVGLLQVYGVNLIIFHYLDAYPHSLNMSCSLLPGYVHIPIITTRGKSLLGLSDPFALLRP